MRKEQIGIGLIGAGNMGRAVARLVDDGSDSAHIQAVYDPDPEAMRACRQLFGDAFHEAPDVSALLARPDLDWVMIASWNCHHEIGRAHV